MKSTIAMALAIMAAVAAFAEKLENGASFSLDAIPAELVAQVPKGQSVRFSLEENTTTGYSWEMEHNPSECDVAMVRKPADSELVGAPGQVMVEVKSKVQTPARVEFRYRRPWEKDAKPAHALRLLVYTVGTNNFDPTPKDLSRWLEDITWLDLKGSDIWTPACLKHQPPSSASSGSFHTGLF